MPRQLQLQCAWCVFRAFGLMLGGCLRVHNNVALKQWSRYMFVAVLTASAEMVQVF